ncbi:hypothetical protein FsymDg_0259 [Candidatus Protofrankia datiscae]|uniref:Uncharacterized protein n=1 Tax=Candidatus Protofrankia datiscae TaxID=2716812 RepID=F8B3J4_9ACTN|nr:hypothetical protein FsymDg_0259 [Candidatus Protofrankia datiscae]
MLPVNRSTPLSGDPGGIAGYRVRQGKHNRHPTTGKPGTRTTKHNLHEAFQLCYPSDVNYHVEPRPRIAGPLHAGLLLEAFWPPRREHDFDQYCPGSLAR